MPIIHKLQSEIVNNELLGFANAAFQQRFEKYQRASSNSLQKYMFYCECLHPEENHHEFNGYICSYSGEYCECKGLKPISLRLLVIITSLDEFETETLDLPEKDSFEYWNEFNLWRIRHGNN